MAHCTKCLISLIPEPTWCKVIHILQIWKPEPSEAASQWQSPVRSQVHLPVALCPSPQSLWPSASPTVLCSGSTLTPLALSESPRSPTGPQVKSLQNSSARKNLQPKIRLEKERGRKVARPPTSLQALLILSPQVWSPSIYLTTTSRVGGAGASPLPVLATGPSHCYSPFTDGKLRHGEAAWTTRGISSTKHQSWGLSPGLAAPGLSPYSEHCLVRWISVALLHLGHVYCFLQGRGRRTAVQNPEGECSAFWTLRSHILSYLLGIVMGELAH